MLCRVRILFTITLDWYCFVDALAHCIREFTGIVGFAFAFELRSRELQYVLHHYPSWTHTRMISI